MLHMTMLDELDVRHSCVVGELISTSVSRSYMSYIFICKKKTIVTTDIRGVAECCCITVFIK